jgi:hypothetical protein
MSNSIIPGNILSTTQLDQLFELSRAQSWQAAGYGNVNAQYQTILSRFDRLGKNNILPNHELTGFTFFTRPKLNLASSSIQYDRILSTINTLAQTTIPFSLRCYLDTKFAHGVLGTSSTTQSWSPDTSKSPFFNDQSPFIVPLSNCITSISGWPDYHLETEDSQGGFFSENITYPSGSDRGNKSNQLSISFRDISGGYIFTLLFLWMKWIDLATKGEVIAYPEDIANRRMCFTTSIYRFIMDSSKTYITKWAKATGCFPVSSPTGAIFNIGEKESWVSGADRINVTFTANDIKYMDPIIFRDFNAIVGRYCSSVKSLISLPNKPSNNFAGIPYIDVDGSISKSGQGRNQLCFMATNDEIQYLANGYSTAQNAPLNIAALTNNPLVTNATNAGFSNSTLGVAQQASSDISLFKPISGSAITL